MKPSLLLRIMLIFSVMCMAPSAFAMKEDAQDKKPESEFGTLIEEMSTQEWFTSLPEKEKKRICAGLKAEYTDTKDIAVVIKLRDDKKCERLIETQKEQMFAVESLEEQIKEREEEIEKTSEDKKISEWQQEISEFKAQLTPIKESLDRLNKELATLDKAFVDDSVPNPDDHTPTIIALSKELDPLDADVNRIKETRPPIPEASKEKQKYLNDLEKRIMTIEGETATIAPEISDSKKSEASAEHRDSKKLFVDDIEELEKKEMPLSGKHSPVIPKKILTAEQIKDKEVNQNSIDTYMLIMGSDTLAKVLTNQALTEGERKSLDETQKSIHIAVNNLRRIDPDAVLSADVENFLAVNLTAPHQSQEETLAKASLASSDVPALQPESPDETAPLAPDDAELKASQDALQNALNMLKDFSDSVKDSKGKEEEKSAADLKADAPLEFAATHDEVPPAHAFKDSEEKDTHPSLSENDSNPKAIVLEEDPGVEISADEEKNNKEMSSGVSLSDLSYADLERMLGEHYIVDEEDIDGRNADDSVVQDGDASSGDEEFPRDLSWEDIFVSVSDQDIEIRAMLIALMGEEPFAHQTVRFEIILDGISYAMEYLAASEHHPLCIMVTNGLREEVVSLTNDRDMRTTEWKRNIIREFLNQARAFEKRYYEAREQQKQKSLHDLSFIKRMGMHVLRLNNPWLTVPVLGTYGLAHRYSGLKDKISCAQAQIVAETLVAVTANSLLTNKKNGWLVGGAYFALRQLMQAYALPQNDPHPEKNKALKISAVWALCFAGAYAGVSAVS